MQKQFLILLLAGLLLLGCTGCKAEAVTSPHADRIERVWVKDRNHTVQEKTYFRDASGQYYKITEQVWRD